MSHNILEFHINIHKHEYHSTLFSLTGVCARYYGVLQLRVHLVQCHDANACPSKLVMCIQPMHNVIPSSNMFVP